MKVTAASTNDRDKKHRSPNRNMSEPTYSSRHGRERISYPLADSERTAARYRNAERDLCMAGVDAKMFETEDSAARWLDDA